MSPVADKEFVNMDKRTVRTEWLKRDHSQFRNVEFWEIIGVKSGVYSFPRAVITKYGNLGIIRQLKFILSKFWRSENQGVSRIMFSLKLIAENLLHAFLLAPGIHGNSWLIGASLQPLSAFIGHLTFSLCLSLSLSIFLFSSRH